jgi:hypothetical protein
MNKLFLLLFIFGCCGIVTAKGWRTIEPLHSTRADVEALKDIKVIRCGPDSCLYDLDDERVFVLYAGGEPCSNNDAVSGWRVSRGTVIQIGVHFKTPRRLEDLGVEMSKFEKVLVDETPGVILYVNQDEGVRLEGGIKTVSNMTYFQSSSDNNLRCAKTVSPFSGRKVRTRSFFDWSSNDGNPNLSY